MVTGICKCLGVTGVERLIDSRLVTDCKVDLGGVEGVKTLLFLSKNSSISVEKVMGVEGVLGLS